MVLAVAAGDRHRCVPAGFAMNCEVVLQGATTAHGWGRTRTMPMTMRCAHDGALSASIRQAGGPLGSLKREEPV